MEQTHLNQEIGISSKLLVIGFRIHHWCTLEANCKMRTIWIFNRTQVTWGPIYRLACTWHEKSKCSRHLKSLGQLHSAQIKFGKATSSYIAPLANLPCLNIALGARAASHYEQAQPLFVKFHLKTSHIVGFNSFYICFCFSSFLVFWFELFLYLFLPLVFLCLARRLPTRCNLRLPHCYVAKFVSTQNSFHINRKFKHLAKLSKSYCHKIYIQH